jgi:2'-5' RNA ligase
MVEGEKKDGRRLFFALPVEGSLNGDALTWQAGHVGWPVNWLSGDKLHITVVSPWFETEIEKVKALIDGLKSTTAKEMYISELQQLKKELK